MDYRQGLHHARVFVIFSIIWIILQEELSVANAVTGGVIGLGTMALTNRYVLRGDYRSSYPLGFLAAVRYLFFLIIQIYVAGFQAVYRMVTRTLHVDIVEITTTLRSEFHIALLANSITLTPGTVTLERNGNRLRVIWIDCVTRDPEEAGRRIKMNFERLLEGEGR